MLRHTTALRVVGVAGPPVPGAAPAEVPPALARTTASARAATVPAAAKVPVWPALVPRRAAAPAQMVAAMPLRAVPAVLVQLPAWVPTAIARTARARVRRVSSRGSPGARRGFFAARVFSRARPRAPRATRARAGSRRPRSTRDPSSNVPVFRPFYEARARVKMECAGAASKGDGADWNRRRPGGT